MTALSRLDRLRAALTRVSESVETIERLPVIYDERGRVENAATDALLGVSVSLRNAELALMLVCSDELLEEAKRGDHAASV